MEENQVTQKTSFPVIGLTLQFLALASIGFIVSFVLLTNKEPKAISTNESILSSADEDIPQIFRTNKEVRYYRSTSVRHKVESLTKKLFSSPSKQIQVTSSDLNGWATVQYQSNSHNLTESENGKPSVSITPLKPEFQIADKMVHIRYPMTIEAFGQKYKYSLLCSGFFKTVNMSPQWQVSSMSVNSAPIPFKKSIYNLLKPKMLEAISRSEDMEKIQSAWNVIKEIEITDTIMVLHLK